MARSEQQFINGLKKQIELKFSFGNGHGYTQRDLEILSALIEEKTGVSISLSTLKRLWRDNYKQNPQLATLNALVQVLNHKDWQSFKLANQKIPRSNTVMIKWILPVLALTIVIVASIFGLSLNISWKRNTTDKSPRITGPISFEVSKTVSVGIPNTVIFKYDVSNVIADTFCIQQSWNEDHRVVINPKGNVLSSIYYESGYHRAKLVADDSVIAIQPIHIISRGWEPHVYRSDSDPELVDFKNENFISNGILHIDSIILKKRKIDFSKKFHSRITNSQAFNLHSDNFSFETRIKADSLFNQLCGYMDVIIVTDVQTFMVSWTERGCEKYAAYKLGEILKKGTENDLSALGCNIFDWQELEVRVKDRSAEIYLNGRSVFREKYQQNFGTIVSLIFLFDGTGSIDYARLKNGDGQVIFDDDFAKP